MQEFNDVFFEQIVPIKKTGGQIATIILIWLLAFVVAAFIYFFLMPALAVLGGFGLLLIFGVFYLAWKFNVRFNKEYEYIITNGTLDIDLITNKSMRNRALSLELSNVTQFERFNPAKPLSVGNKKPLVACNLDDENAVVLVADRDGKESAYLVFAPDEKLMKAILKAIPLFVSNKFN